MKLDGEAARPWAGKNKNVPEPATTLFARKNRSEPTDAERKLWPHLKRLGVDGSHFRRQVVIGSVIADFASRRARLIVELDGGQHCENAKDVARTAKLEADGWRVLRFWNHDVMSNLNGVLEIISVELNGAGHAQSGTTPTPDPSPQGGGEIAP